MGSISACAAAIAALKVCSATRAFSRSHEQETIQLVDVDRRIACGTLDHLEESEGGEFSSPASGGGQGGDSFGGSEGGVHGRPPSPCRLGVVAPHPAGRIGIILRLAFAC